MDETQKVELVRGKLEDINLLITPYKLAYVSPKDDCVLLERNAHFMDKEKFDRLTENIQKDGFLSQLPFGLKMENGKYKILSGNHRIKAALKAKLDYVLIMYVENLTRDEELGYQLSHNTLVGKDDMQMLKDLFNEIEGLAQKEFTGLNDLMFLDYQTISLPSISEDDIKLHEIKFVFTQFKAERIREVLEALDKRKMDENSAFCFVNFVDFIRIMTEVKKRTNIKNNTIAFIKMLEICEQKIKEIDEQESNGESEEKLG
jgi:hypothetical protein